MQKGGGLTQALAGQACMPCLRSWKKAGHFAQEGIIHAVRGEIGPVEEKANRRGRYCGMVVEKAVLRTV